MASEIQPALSLAQGAPSTLKNSSDLWASALGKLDPAAQKELDINGLKLSDLDRCLVEVEAKQQQWADKKWKIKFRGREYELYDMWGKIIGWIGTFKDLIGSLVALDSSGKAAIPWAAIKFVLRALEYEQEQFSTISVAMATVIEVITYYAKFEPLYFEKDLGVVKYLKEAVLEVYTSILRILCLAKSYYAKKSSNKPHNQVRGLFFNPKMFQDELDRIENGQKKVNLWVNLVHRETETDMSGQLRAIQDFLRAHEYRIKLNAISDISAVQDHVSHSCDRLRDTGLWLINNDKFQAWRCSPRSSLFWLRGSAGTGKTTLTSLVIDSFLRHLRPTHAPVVYFYVKPGHTAIMVLRSLVRQLVLQSDPEEFFSRHTDDDMPLSYQHCLTHIERMIKPHESVTLIIDSMDSPYESDSLDSSYPSSSTVPSAKTFLDLLNDLSGIMQRATRPFNIYLSSQNPNDGIDTFCKQLPQTMRRYQITVDAKSESQRNDIRRFIAHEVKGWSRSQFLPQQEDVQKVEEAKDAIIREVSKKAGEMFLWVVHVLRSIFRDNSGLRTLDDVMGELQKDRLPKSVRNLYNRSYTAIYSPDGSETTRMAGRALRLLVSGAKQLSSHAFIDALRRSRPKR
ncbi:hypothetical protein QBC44DRAFT_94962 [Cladorrhinum sp. PSN332]|nr:hypothetical protein QBC44DRAFT_94962 [Cladorrhinum sp. PSN332]